MQSPAIYLDYNATTPLLPEVVEAMLPWLRDGFGNPSSGHAWGRAARAAVDDARARVAELLGAQPDEIVFTSGGTEANNLAIRGVVEATGTSHLVTSVVEHPAVEEPCRWLEARGVAVTRLPVDGGGRVTAAGLAEELRPDTGLLTVMHSNNEIGTLQPVAELATAAHRVGAVVHTDAAQSVGKVPVLVDELGVDLLTVAGHKLYAPKGVGALYVRRGTPLRPFVLGAGHERGLRPGTENVASLVGLGVAAAVARATVQDEARRVSELRDLLWERLSSLVPGLCSNGDPAHRLPNTLNVRFPEVLGTELLERTPEVAATTGSACHDGATTASAVVLAMGVDPRDALGSVRLSLGRGTTREEVDRAAAALSRSWVSLVQGQRR